MQRKRKLQRNIRKTRILEILKSRRLLSASDLEWICTKLILSAGVLADPTERLDRNSLEVLSEVNSQILYGFVVYRVVNNTWKWQVICTDLSYTTENNLTEIMLGSWKSRPYIQNFNSIGLRSNFILL